MQIKYILLSTLILISLCCTVFAETKVDSDVGTGGGYGDCQYSIRQWCSTIVKTSKAYSVTTVMLRLKDGTGNPTMNLWVTLNTNISGTGRPATGAPSQILCSSNQVSATVLTSSYAYINFTFASPCALNASTKYWITLNGSAYSDTNDVAWDGGGTGSQNGNYTDYWGGSGSTWGVLGNNQNHWFMTFESSGSPTNTCTYGGSGNWLINCSDNCNLTTTTNVSTNLINFTGDGLIRILANISAGKIAKDTTCQINNTPQDNKGLLVMAGVH